MPTTDIEILESESLEEEDEINEVNSIKIFDKSFVKLVEIRNTLATLQKLCFYQEKSNDVVDLLQQFETL